MCEHCERAIKNALESLDGVISAEASFEKGTAVVRSSKEPDEDAVRKAVEGEDYGFEGIL